MRCNHGTWMCTVQIQTAGFYSGGRSVGCGTAEVGLRDVLERLTTIGGHPPPPSDPLPPPPLPLFEAKFSSMPSAQEDLTLTKFAGAFGTRGGGDHRRRGGPAKPAPPQPPSSLPIHPWWASLSSTSATCDLCIWTALPGKFLMSVQGATPPKPRGRRPGAIRHVDPTQMRGIVWSEVSRE